MKRKKDLNCFLKTGIEREKRDNWDLQEMGDPEQYIEHYIKQISLEYKILVFHS